MSRAVYSQHSRFIPPIKSQYSLTPGGSLFYSKGDGVKKEELINDIVKKWKEWGIIANENSHLQPLPPHSLHHVRAEIIALIRPC